jgi:quercetin dioxygenase-like cupin family protein
VRSDVKRVDMTDMAHAQVLADLVQYQSGAVVSRTLIKKPAGTVTLFAFDAGEELSEHTAPYEALVVLLDGQANVTVGSLTERVVAGQTLNLPAGVPHALKAESAFKMMLVMIRD